MMTTIDYYVAFHREPVILSVKRPKSLRRLEGLGGPL